MAALAASSAAAIAADAAAGASARAGRDTVKTAAEVRTASPVRARRRVRDGRGGGVGRCGDDAWLAGATALAAPPAAGDWERGSICVGVGDRACGWAVAVVAG